MNNILTRSVSARFGGLGSVALLVVLLVAVLLSSAARANQASFMFENFAAEQGLDNVYVLKVLQDGQGFIWVATEGGLYRYDGYTFKRFSHDPDDPTSLGGNYIHNLYIDAQGILWASVLRSGFAQYNAKTETFINYRHDPQNANSLSSNDVTALIEDKKGDLWITTFGGGLNHFDRQTGTFTHYRYDVNDPTSISDDRLYTVLEDRQGVIWVGSRDGGLNRFDTQTGLFTRYQYDGNDPASLSHNKVFTLLEDNIGGLWVGTRGGGINRLDRSTGQFERFVHKTSDYYSLSHDWVYAVFEDQAGSLWVGTRGGGLNRLDRKTRRFHRYQHDAQNKRSLADNNIRSITQDRNGLIWLGSYGGGISKFDPASERFGLVQHDDNNPNSLGSGSVQAILKDSSQIIWVGTDNGLSRYDEEANLFSHYQHQFDDPQSLSDNNISALFEDSSGILWVGTYQHGLNRFNLNNGIVTRYRHDPKNKQSLSDDIIYVIHQDRFGDLWVGTQTGLNRMNLNTNKFTRYSHSDGVPDSIAHDSINTLYTGTDGSLWVGTNGGLSHFNHQNQRFSNYIHDPNNINSLSNNRVLGIHQDAQGMLWIGTDGGLNQLDLQTGQFSTVREKQGLASDNVSSVLSDSQHNLWLGLDGKGIAMYNPILGVIKNYIGAEAGCSTDFNSHFQAADGQLFYGRNGYCAFYPDVVFRPSQPGPLVFTDFRLLNRSVSTQVVAPDSPLSQVINHTDELTLTHKDNVLSFEFAALHYIDATNNQYKYKLDGFNRDWIATGADNRRATFTNLSAGNYTFRVKASNHQGLWSEQERAIEMTILPAPWLTWWAYAIYTLSFGFVIGIIAYQRHERARALILAKNNAELARANAEKARQNAEKANESKSIFIANVSHEIRTPLNAVLGYSQMLERDKNLTDAQRDKLEVIKNSGNQLLDLINDILDISKIEAQAMKLVTVDFDLVDLIKGIGMILTGRCEEKQLQWQLVNQCGASALVHGDQSKLRQILLHLLGNAVKFTHEGTVTLTLSVAGENHYRFEISDSGMGIEQANQSDIFNAFGQTVQGSEMGGTGLGLAIASNQISLMGGDLQVQSESGQGSRFFFSLPLESSQASVEQIEVPVSCDIPGSVDFSALCLPTALYETLHRAACDYDISKVEACLSELVDLGPHEAQFADHLRQYLSSYDMDGLVEALEVLAP
jgi:two-component system sensor histidine kinase ChiS